ncbi:hypothetical protein BURK1_00331 [Burkholderiales bacterium]|nr:hypothetical protein BURK1_00331 [Burkholderiales bacterium]
MRFRKTLVAALCAASIGGVALPMTSGAQVGIYLNMAPPAARYEAVPAPRRGYVWSPGYWNVRGSRHVWQRGHWERQRVGYYRSQPKWVQRDDRWQLERGRWIRGDRDRDGIPNAVDRDRDGDGVPNVVDRAPDNPVRR